MNLRRFWNGVRYAMAQERKEEQDKRAFQHFLAQTPDAAHLPSDSSPVSGMFMSLLVKWVDSGIDQFELSGRGPCSCEWPSDVIQRPIELIVFGRWMVLTIQHSAQSVEHGLWTEHRLDLHRDGKCIPVYIRLHSLPSEMTLAALEDQAVKLTGQPDMIFSRKPMC